MVWRPLVPFAPPLRSCGSTGVQRSPCAAELPQPLKTWPSFDAEGVGTACWRLVEAFVHVNGRRGQRGDEIGHSGTRVRQWCRRERAPSERTAFWRARRAPGLAFPGIRPAGGNVKDVPTVPGSYLTPSGSRGTGSAAAGRSRRLRRARDATIPARGKAGKGLSLGSALIRPTGKFIGPRSSDNLVHH